jgi:hypothetical protein
MPNRILKESICTSDTVDRLTWFEEVFFYRLIVNCDDFGRMDARPAILKARLFPLKSITEKQIGDALNKLSTVGIVTVYKYDGRPYLQLVTWEYHQSIRAKKSKYPAPDESEIICMQMKSDEIKCSRNPIQSESESESESNTPAAHTGDIFVGRSFSQAMKDKLTEWLEYKKERRESYKPMGLKSFLTEVENKLKRNREEDVIALINECMANNWQGIIWDKIKGRSAGPQRVGAKPNDFEHPAEDYDKLAVNLFDDC